MDKSTLSNYGWIVIAVLVLSVMIALATPFGKYVEQAVWSTTEGLFDTSEKALNVVGLSAGGGNSGTPTKDPALNPTGPIGSTYVYGDIVYRREVISGNELGASTIEEGKEIAKQNVIINRGMTWDEFLARMAEEYGLTEDMLWEDACLTEETFEPAVLADEWIISGVTDQSKIQYGPILESINGVTITTIKDYAFSHCESLISIIIPDNITTIGDYAFSNCALLGSVIIPDGVTYISDGTFANCGNLRHITIPNSVREFGYEVFSNNSGRMYIKFNGTTAQWRAILKPTVWNSGNFCITVTCTDGTEIVNPNYA